MRTRFGDLGTPARGGKLRPRVRGPDAGGRSRRPLAALLVIAAVGLPIVLSESFLADRPRLAGTPPYPLPSALGTTLLGAPWDTARHLGGPAVLLYVSDRCPHCRAELRTWASLGGWEAPVPLWIVASPRSELKTLGWVPPRLRRRVVSDDEGSIAEALGVSAVPATLWVDGDGVVRDQWLGRSSPARLKRAAWRLVAGASPDPAPVSSQPSPDPGGRP